MTVCVCLWLIRQWSAQAVELDGALASEEAEESRMGLGMAMPTMAAASSAPMAAGMMGGGYRGGDDLDMDESSAAVSAMRKARRGKNDRLASQLQMAKKGSPSMFSSPKP